LSACAPWDQTVFQPRPEPPPAAPPSAEPAPRVDPRAPLATIDFADPSVQYEAPLRGAVRAAEQRRPGISYDVVGIVPSAERAAAGQVAAQEAMGAIARERVPAERIRLGLRVDPSLTATRVLVYVR
jgi:hypothetical protein